MASTAFTLFEIFIKRSKVSNR